MTERREYSLGESIHFLVLSSSSNKFKPKKTSTDQLLQSEDRTFLHHEAHDGDRVKDNRIGHEILTLMFSFNYV